MISHSLRPTERGQGSLCKDRPLLCVQDVYQAYPTESLYRPSPVWWDSGGWGVCLLLSDGVMTLRQYSKLYVNTAGLFGIPGQGVHKYRWLLF